MKFSFALAALVSCAVSAVQADAMRLHATAMLAFDDLPSVMPVDDVRAVCGGGVHTNPDIGYCTTDNTIYVTVAVLHVPARAYDMAHVLGHAIQVRHGVADVALREIRNRRDEEDALRGMVTRQVECVAGVLMAQAGVPAADLGAAFGGEPFTDAHWGRNPINVGPRVSIGLAARQDWYDIGYSAQDFTACTVGDMSSQLIVDAQRR